MRKLTILLLGMGGNVSQGILKAIRNYGFAKEQVEVKIVGACISAASAGLYMCDKACLSPYASDSGFVDWVIEVCNREQVDMILTGVEENIIALQAEKDKLQGQTKALFVASPLDMLQIGQDKFATCEWLKRNGCAYPEYCRFEDKEAVRQLVQKVGFPLIAKPCHGKGSGGLYYLENRASLEALRVSESYVLQECVGDSEKEYTVGCYCDKEGKLREMIIMHRRLEHGSSVAVEVVHDESIKSEAEKICQAFQPSGPLNIQMRKDDSGRAVCFELNVRFSGTTPMRSHFGYQDVAAMIKEYCLGEEIGECFKVHDGVAYRYTNEFYLQNNAEAVLRTGTRMLDMVPFNLEEAHIR